jgi:membrane dipeptidase
VQSPHIASPRNRTESTVADWAGRLGISQHALDLYLAADVVDLHIDSFIWTRLCGYRLDRRHSEGLLRARYCRQVDIPRIREARIGGAAWIITTNPWRTEMGRARALRRNLARLTQILSAQATDVQLVRSLSEYRNAKASGRHAAWLAIQGGNALAHPSSWDLLESYPILLVTLVHLTNSALGFTSSPLRLRPDSGLTNRGRALIELLNQRKVLVDLAHASQRTFDDALQAHDKTIPALVSHTGLAAVHPHWRNLSDQQLRSIADTGGVAGVFFFGPYLGTGMLGGSVECVARHIAHAVRVVGAEHVSLGSDWDGMIVTPRDMRTCVELPRLVQALLNAGLTDSQIQMVLGGSFLRLLGMVHP